MLEKFCGCLEGVLRVSRGCLEGVWTVSGRCLEGIYGMSEWYVSVRYLDVSEGQVRTPNVFGPKIFLHLKLVGLDTFLDQKYT